MLIATQSKGLPSVLRYKNLKRIYTVWVILECDVEEAIGTVTRYGMSVQLPWNNERTYDGLTNKSNIIVVCLNKESKNEYKECTGPKVLGILDMIFSGNMCDEERKNELREIYKLDLDLLLIREARVMTNLLQEEYEMGKEEGKLEGKLEDLLNMIRNKGLDRETAIQYVDLPDEYREEILSRLDAALGAN